MVAERPGLTAIDLFCGAGGLSYGLQRSGVSVAAGVDLDPSCRYPFESNVGAKFLEKDVADISAWHLRRLWRNGDVRILAGCAPCQPFSPHRRGADTSQEEQWSLLAEFTRLVDESRPEVVTMENVPRMVSSEVFADFTEALQDWDYHVDWQSCHGPKYGLPQSRRRLVLLASRLGPIEVPSGSQVPPGTTTVRSAIGDLPPLEAGAADPGDPLHKARALSPLNLKRIQASTPGGTWKDWPRNLRAPCHRRKSGASFRSVYARMEWDKPSPTITTLAHNFGTGRFGHPEQDRSMTLREAAMLQGFPRDYRFVAPGNPVRFDQLGRLIGNAVPPPLGEAIGYAIVEHVTSHRGP